MRQAAVRQRRAVLDLCRLAAAYAIVWLHAVQSPELANSTSLGRFAVPFFVFATVLLTFETVGANPQRGRRKYVASRFWRLYVPFLAWSGLYLAFKLAKGTLLPGEPNNYPGINLLWTGGCWHLWFLPLILVVNLAAFETARLLAVRPALAPHVLAISLAAGALVASLPVAPDVEPSSSELLSLVQYRSLVTDALPAVFWGIALAIACRVHGARIFEHRASACVGVLLALISTAWIWHFGRDRLAETLAGLGFVLFAFPLRGAGFQVASSQASHRPGFRGASFQLAIPRLAEQAGSLAFGVYLAHILWIKVLHTVAAKSGIPVCWELDVAVFFLSAIASTVLAWAAARSRWTRWTVA
jgi:peptidoglycan/LPS O-acetylase OafA/YrhL